MLFSIFNMIRDIGAYLEHVMSFYHDTHVPSERNGLLMWIESLGMSSLPSLALPNFAYSEDSNFEHGRGGGVVDAS